MVEIALSPLRSHYEAGRVAALANVGPLVRPVTKGRNRVSRKDSGTPLPSVPSLTGERPGLFGNGGSGLPPQAS